MRAFPKITRRRLLKIGGASLGTGIAAALYAWRIEPHWVRVAHRPMPIVGLPRSLEGRRLVQVSDLHVGPIVDIDYLIDSMKLITSLDPDLTVITGDFMTCRWTDCAGDVSRVLEYLKPGPLGCFATLGNHDYGWGWQQIGVAETLKSRLRDQGIRLLQNDLEIVAGLQLLGVDDLWGPNFDAKNLATRVNPSLPTITLCHNPDAVDLAEMAAIPGWVLSGHTHGGQVKPPFLPPPIMPVRNRRYTAGEFALSGGRTLYINPGLGYSHRLRFNMRPEVTVFELEAA
ncbi:MAG: metallophosphoesterase [Pirellulales bacterium]|nr:metallophosphoesterase [Pirellulales bacterium]